MSELWKKVNILFDTFQKSPVGKFILEKILFRSKGFISVYYTFVVMLLVQIASLSYVDEIVKFLDEKIANPEYLPKIVWQILKIFAPEGNILLIAVLIPAIIGLWWIRNKELTIEKKPKELTGHTYTEGFVGRAKELKIIEKTLKSSSSLLLINGIGGIGKTSLANEYLTMHKKQYAHYAFINAQTDIRLSLFQQFEKPLNLTKQESIEADFREVLGELRKLDGKKLLVLDDIKEVKNQREYILEILKLRDREFELLFTSRENIEDVQSHHLDVLDEEEAKELFNSIVKVTDEKLLEEILVYLDYHTLFIEITAKTLKENDTLTPKKLLEKFKNGEFSKVNKNFEESFSLFLSNLFSFDKLNKEAVLQLKQLSALPSIEIEFQKLVELLGVEEQEEFELILNYLSSRGWLIKSEKGYKLHQIIKEYLLAKHIPSFEEIEVVLDSIKSLIKDSVDTPITVENRENIIYFESLATLLYRLGIENEKVGGFLGYWGNISFTLGLYKKAETLYLKALNISEKVLGEEHLETAINYNNLAELYNNIGEYQEAKLLYLKALNINKKLLGEEHLVTATNYNNLAGLYDNMDEHQKAENLYLKALEIKEKVLGKKHREIATIYNNLAELYRRMEKYQKAKSFYLKALEIREKVLGDEHHETATTYNNLALLYKSMGKYQKAKPLYLKALKIREKVLGKEHDLTAGSYNNLAIFYYSQGEFNKAYECMKRAIEVLSKIFPSNHPNLISSKRDLKVIEEKL